MNTKMGNSVSAGFLGGNSGSGRGICSADAFAYAFAYPIAYAFVSILPAEWLIEAIHE